MSTLLLGKTLVVAVELEQGDPTQQGKLYVQSDLWFLYRPLMGNVCCR